MKGDAGLSEALLQLLGPEAFLRLAEHHAGTRVYVPNSLERNSLVRSLGEEAASKLSRRYGGTYLRVPLARELRARQYRAAGMTNAQIASRLGMVETGVNKLFERMADVPAKGSDPRQLKLFG